MACITCAKKQQYANMSYYSPSEVQSEEDCHFTKQEIETRKQELEEEKSTASPTRLTRISYDIFRLNRALKKYDINCNKYLKDLYEIIQL